MSDSSLNILISGGTGFIGKHLVPKLTEAGPYSQYPQQKRQGKQRSIYLLPEMEW